MLVLMDNWNKFELHENSDNLDGFYRVLGVKSGIFSGGFRWSRV
jgi:hypothetical protein